MNNMASLSPVSSASSHTSSSPDPTSLSSSSSPSPFPHLHPALWTNASLAPPNRTLCTFDDPALRLPLALLYSLVFLAGLLGNLLALWVFLFLHARRNSVRVLLINCALADLVLLACLPFRVAYHLRGDRWALGALACRLVGNLFYMNMYVSITLLGLISLDRYVRLRGGGGGGGGGRARRLWGKGGAWSWAACGLLWGGSLAAMVPMFARAEGNEEEGRCFQYKQRLGAPGKAYFNLALVGLFWAVFALLVASYWRIAARLLRVSRDKPDLPNARRYGRTARNSFFVLFLFTACFGPYHAFRPVYVASQLSPGAPCAYLRRVDRTNEVMLLLAAFNSCLDPVMYFLLSGSVRRAALRALGACLGGRPRFLNDVAVSNSSTELRRGSGGPTGSGPGTGANTPRTSVCLVNASVLRR